MKYALRPRNISRLFGFTTFSSIIFFFFLSFPGFICMMRISVGITRVVPLIAAPIPLFSPHFVIQSSINFFDFLSRRDTRFYETTILSIPVLIIIMINKQFVSNVWKKNGRRKEYVRETKHFDRRWNEREESSEIFRHCFEHDMYNGLKGELGWTRAKLFTPPPPPTWLAAISRLNREIQRFDLDQSGRKCVWPTTITNNDPRLRETGFPWSIISIHIDLSLRCSFFTIPSLPRTDAAHRLWPLSLTLSLSLLARLEFLYTFKMENRSPRGK